MQWIYRFSSNDAYPDPFEEISTLSALQEEGDDVYLLLNNREHPPLCTGTVDEVIGLCTTCNNKLILHGVAAIKSEPARSSTPESVRPLYGQHVRRFFCPLSDISLNERKELPTSILSDDEQRVFIGGQATARRLSHGNTRDVTKRIDFDWANGFRSVAKNYCHNQEQFVVGLDPTAGTWDSRMKEGSKSMPSFGLRLDDKGIHAIDNPLATHNSNEEFWKRVAQLKAVTVCIDGPCKTNGPRCEQAWTGWECNSPNGTRIAERELFAQGVKLFWTTRNTVNRFDGASRWIARSLRLFSESSENAVKAIETHPHGAFTFLARALGSSASLPKKTSNSGRVARIALLKSFIPNLEADMMPDHDAVDAACAALVAALYARNNYETISFGSEEEGGLIYMPKL